MADEYDQLNLSWTPLTPAQRKFDLDERDFWLLMLTGLGVLTAAASPAAAVRTPSITRRTDSLASPIAAGAKSVTFKFNAGFTGTVLGVAFTDADLSVTFSAPDQDTLAAMAYTVTAGSMDIIKIA